MASYAPQPTACAERHRTSTAVCQSTAAEQPALQHGVRTTAIALLLSARADILGKGAGAKVRPILRQRLVPGGGVLNTCVRRRLDETDEDVQHIIDAGCSKA